ncbi:nuclease-related domain-containing protein [Neptuniibacter halophilus]|uniref:nuclease-related domain-containing protein n=1 Tax=Neptuniibacter halophilus TaxID=651666 RepID=UPI002573561A|nr:NERD domain-containing protein [Neptuniibacter halophilus]
MDFSPVYDQLFGMLWYLIPLALFISLIKSPWFKGVVGEVIVNLAAKFFLDKQQYHLIKNVTLPTEEGTTQIDHIIVSRFGVFVIETKNMKGWIFGSVNQPYWTQQIYKHKSKFQNPLRQNYKHVKTLESALAIDPAGIHSLIVFVGDATFKTEMPANVTFVRGYIRYIKDKQNPVLSQAQVRLIIKQIERGRLERSVKTHIEHARHVQAIVEKKATDPSCPRCSSAMVLREVKKGQNTGQQFWGCSQFPKCRGSIKTSA